MYFVFAENKRQFVDWLFDDRPADIPAGDCYEVYNIDALGSRMPQPWDTIITLGDTHKYNQPRKTALRWIQAQVNQR